MVDAREYHERTKHSPESVRQDSFSLDFPNKPRPAKQYVDLPTASLPPEADPPDRPALEAIANPRARPESGQGRTVAEDEPESGDTPASQSSVPLQDLQTLCHYATGITKHLEIQGRRTPFRAAACTGKLYHIDLYAVTGPLPTREQHATDVDAADIPAATGTGSALAPGVYHFDPESGDFDVLREGDYRGVLAAAAGKQDLRETPITFVATSQWWRNAWKYRERTYRHAFWDSGTILANLLATAHGLGHRASVVTGFADDPVAELLGVDPEREAPLELVSVGSEAPAPALMQDPLGVDRIDPDEEALSPSVVDYPLVPDAWRQSKLDDGTAATEWRAEAAALGGDDVGTHGIGDGELVSLQPVDRETASSRPIGRTIERRGSLREYDHDAISDRRFATVLDRAFRGVPIDVEGDGSPSAFVDVYTLVHAVDGIASGAYQYHPSATALERLGETSREEAGRLALGQSVVGDAAANVYVMADVDALVEQLGNRGYRVAQLLGGIALGRLYLATYAHRAIGGRGFTFFDDLVTDAFSPRAANQTPMTLFAFGKPHRE